MYSQSLNENSPKKHQKHPKKAYKKHTKKRPKENTARKHAEPPQRTRTQLQGPPDPEDPENPNELQGTLWHLLHHGNSTLASLPKEVQIDRDATPWQPGRYIASENFSQTEGRGLGCTSWNREKILANTLVDPSKNLIRNLSSYFPHRNVGVLAEIGRAHV